ncbi:acyl-homoserine-lactone synthase [Pseudomonadota bacterium]
MTIESFNFATAHFYGDALASQFRLRQRVFIDRQDYQVNSWKGMEFDQFDTPATQYFVWRDETGEVRGVARMAPTTLKYMIEEVWPEMVTEIDLPHSEQVWEGTRFGVDRDLSPELRSQVIKELVCAYMEYAVMNDIDEIIGLMPVGITRAVFNRNGWKNIDIGPVWLEDGIKVQAGILPVNAETLHNVRHRTKMHDVLHVDGEDRTHVTPLKAA